LGDGALAIRRASFSIHRSSFLRSASLSMLGLHLPPSLDSLVSQMNSPRVNVALKSMVTPTVALVNANTAVPKTDYALTPLDAG
jgi:hypothetical protein